MKNIYTKFETIALKHAQKLALEELKFVNLNLKVSYGQLLNKVNSLAYQFQTWGIHPGDKILILVPMSIPLYICILATIKLGAVCVFIDPHVGLSKFNDICKNARPKIFIGIAKAHIFRIFCKALRQVPIKIKTDKAKLLPAKFINNYLNFSQSIKTIAVNPDEPALISYTSGSSGNYKGSVRTHAMLESQIAAIEQPPQKMQTRSDLPAFPFLPLDDLLHGRTAFLPNIPPGQVGMVNAKPIIEKFKADPPEMVSGSPAYFEKIVKAAENQKFEKIKILFTGGAPLTETNLQNIQILFPHASIYIVYGSTEVEPVASILCDQQYQDLLKQTKIGKGFCVGWPINTIEVKIIALQNSIIESESLNNLELANNQPGEIIVKGPHVNEHYLNDKESENLNKIHTQTGTWHRMGDIGYIDESGKIWLLGRAHNTIKSQFKGKEKTFYHYQVEGILDNCDYIKKSAYMNWEKYTIIVVELEKQYQSEKATVISKIKAKIKDFPYDKIIFIKKMMLDRRHNAKVEYKALKKWLKKRL